MSGRQQQIIATASDLFAQHGYHGVSVHDIGAACGISGPALYKHYPSKQALLAATLIEISETLVDEGRRRVAEADGPAAALDALIDCAVRATRWRRLAKISPSTVPFPGSTA